MEKRRIIFTDFFDTLANRKIKCGNEKEKEEYNKVITFLRQYLSKNNLLVIISSKDHCTLNDFAKIYDNLQSSLNEEQKHSLYFYVVGSTKEENDIELNNFYIVDGDKETIIDKLIKDMNINKNDSIIAAGDGNNDIDMLFRVNDIGGTSYFINKYNMDNVDCDEERIIRRIASKKASLHTTNLRRKDQISKIDNTYYDQIRSDKFNEIYQQLLNLYNSGKLNRNDLENMYFSLSIIEGYNWFNTRNGKIIYNEEIILKKLVLVNNQQEIFTKFRCM